MSDVSTREKGREGEDEACTFLLRLGFEIVERNLSCRFGEIDVVARKQNTLCFVEIKYRKGNSYGKAIESITPAKQKKIRKTAQYLLLTRPEWRECIPYFSVVAIDEHPVDPDKTRVEFIRDAFV